MVERRLRVHVGPRGRLSFTHAGRPGQGDDPGAQSETLTAPISVLRRGPVLLAEPNSAPQAGALSEGLTGPISLDPRTLEEEDE